MYISLIKNWKCKRSNVLVTLAVYLGKNGKLEWKAYDVQGKLSAKFLRREMGRQGVDDERFESILEFPQNLRLIKFTITIVSRLIYQIVKCFDTREIVNYFLYRFWLDENE